ncbi:MAG: preprotein translocase subunit SecE [Clostridia bacterium]|nr:preprotein translocase subunit SecE [Clostridia bacterium]
MAKELEKKADNKKPEVKKKKEKKFQLGAYLKEMWGEVKKLTWLSPKELAKNTGVVIVVVLAVTLLIWVLDLAFGTPMSLLLKAKDSAAELVSSTLFLG